MDLEELGRGKYYDQNIFCFKQPKYLKNINTIKLAYFDIILSHAGKCGLLYCLLLG